MSPKPLDPEPELVTVGWQGVTVQIPPEWNLSAINGDYKGGYVRYDDSEIPRLEIKWATESGFVDLNTVIDKYLRDLQKKRAKGAPEVEVERDIKLISKRRRKKPSLKCFRWTAAARGHGAAWVCKDCGRTMIAQVASPLEMKAADAEELAATILLSIEDHPLDDWLLWSAYGFGIQAPRDFLMMKQKLMAGLIEFSLERETEKLRFARWGLANVALKRKTLAEWAGAELGKELRKQAATFHEAPVMGHPGLHIRGGNIAGAQKLHRFYQHCRGQLYADELIARLWHCEQTNRIYYVETFVDRANQGLADELVARLECHPGVVPDAPPEAREP
jgi:hypothetical protein